MNAVPTSPARLNRGTLIQVLCCVIPSMTLLGLGQMTYAAYAFYAVIGSILGYQLISRRGLDAMSLAVGTIPVIMLLRGLVLYNSLQLILAACVCSVLAIPKEREHLRQNRPLLWLLGTCLTYWLASFIITGDYTSNSRMVELGLAATSVAVLSGHRARLASSAMGIVFSGLLMAAGLMPYGSRLGIASGVSDVTIGNPVTLGLSASLAYLLTIADRGRWLLLHQRPVVRGILGLLAGAALLLSTSRGSWLVTILGALMILFLNRQGRRSLLASLFLVGVMTVFILQTERGAAILHYFDNAVGEDKSLDKRTTGRANQWEALPRIIDESPLWGFGPGSGKSVSLRLTKDGKPWHSLYLHLGAETGLLGLAALFLLLGVLGVRAVGHLRACGEIAPLMALICFVSIGISVSGIDAISGVFLGYAMGAGDYSCFRRIRIGVPVSSDRNEADVVADAVAAR